MQKIRCKTHMLQQWQLFGCRLNSHAELQKRAHVGLRLASRNGVPHGGDFG
jgi:hypothetical protein